jgi:soluble lytic murein transglycosylase-like protein
MKKIVNIFAVFGLISIMGIPVSGGEIYKYVDEEGVIHFTDSPTKEEMVLYIREAPINGSSKRFDPDRFDAIILEASRETGLSFSLIKALIRVESNFNHQAVSHMGAKGLMQIMPKNMKDLDIKDPFDPYQNIMGGSRYLRQMLKRFDGQLVLALAAYNAGPTVVEKYNAVPPYKETRNYVDKIIRFIYTYK